MALLDELVVWLRADLVTSAALLLLLTGPGVMCCWLAYHVTGIRLAPDVKRPAMFRSRARREDRVEERLTSICTALSLLTDSTEAGLKATISGLERLSGLAPAAPEEPRVPQVHVPALPAKGQTPRDLAIAQGVSEGEIRLRMRLQAGSALSNQH